MRRRFPWGYAFLAYVTVFMSSCGFLFVHAPPADHAERVDSFSCTESAIGPALDFVWAGLNAAGAVIAITSDESEIDNRSTVIVVGFGWTIFSTAAGAVGMNKIKKCKDARLAWNRRLRENRRDDGDESESMSPAPAVDSTESVWGRVAEWTDPMFPMPPDSVVSHTNSGS